MYTVGESELLSIYACLEVFLARLAYRYRLDASDLDDIRQDAVVGWWKYTQRTKTMIPPNALARVIARRQVYGHLRREMRLRRHGGQSDVAWIEEKSEEEVLGTDTIHEIIHALHQKGAKGELVVQDGMDLALICYNKDTQILEGCIK